MTLADQLQRKLTGDIAFALRDLAQQDARSHPASVSSYARLSAFEEIAGYFDSEQGIPTADAQALDESLRQPLSRMVKDDGLRDCSDASTDALSDVLLALARLRSK